MEDSLRLAALKRQLRERLGDERFDLWLGAGDALTSSDGVVRVGCQSDFQTRWLRRKLHKPLLEIARDVFSPACEIEFVVAAACEEVAQPAAPEPTDAKLCPADTPQAAPAKPRKVSPSGRRSLANFAAGDANQLALRTAEAAIQQPGRYSPLLIYGPSGVGKTHLLDGVRKALLSGKHFCRALQITAEQFTAEFLTALDRRQLPSFRQKFRSIDALLVDDVQFLKNKRATLDELVFTVESLDSRGRQVVLTADRSPGDLQAVSPELVARISGGISVPIELPELAIRVGIVRSLAGRMNVSLDEPVVELIATQVIGSARQLAGAINRLVVTSMAWQQPITTELARQALLEFTQQSTAAVRLPDIQRAVCEVFGVEPKRLNSKQKARCVSEPRMLAMWLARRHTPAALSEIGDFFGHRKHSTVVAAERRIQRLVSTGAEINVDHRSVKVDEAIRRVEAALRTG